MPNWEGKQLGNYRLIHLLGRGGFGQVYLGKHIYLQTLAAIKLLLEEDEIGEQANTFHEAFLQEARRIAALKHRHILRVLDFGIEGSTPYLVMEYAAHGTLLMRHPRGTYVPLDQVVSYTQQIAQALDYAHEARLIHRDVKPANVLLDESDTVLLSDFGVATIAHHTASMRTSVYVGTPAYMAPEQLQGKPVPASDQYALSIMVYEWLCGRLPYQGDPFAIGMQHLTAPPPPLNTDRQAFSSSLERVVHRAMAKDPAQRFPDVQTFANALAQAAQKNQSIRTSGEKSMGQQDQEEKRSPSSPPILTTTALPSSTTVKASRQPSSSLASNPSSQNQNPPSSSNFFPRPVLQKRRQHNKRFWAALLIIICLVGSSLIYVTWLKTSSASLPPWSMFGENPAHTEWDQQENIITVQNVSHLKLLWNYATGSTTLASPAVFNGHLYLSVGLNDSSAFYSFNAACSKNCQPEWTYPGLISADLATPAVDNTSVYFGAYDGYLYTFSSSCTDSCAPTSTFWIQPDSEPPFHPFVYRSPGSPVLAGNMIYFNAQDGFLYALSTSDCCDQLPLWTYQIEEPTTVNTTQISTLAPAVANNILYDVNPEYGTVYAFDATCTASCQPLWYYETNAKDFTSSPAIGNGIMYVGTENGTFYAFDATCTSLCQPLWSNKLGDAIDSSAAITNQMVYIGVDDKSGAKLEAFSATCRKRCQPLWSYTTPGSNAAFFSAPIVAGDVVFAANQNHILYAFDANCTDNCKPIWQYDLKDTSCASPVVANGRLYMLTEGGMLDVFGLSGT